MSMKNIVVFILVLSFLTGLGVFIKWYDTSRFNAGYAQCEADQKEANEKTLELETQKLRTEFAAVIEQKEQEAADAMALIKELQNRPEITENEIKQVVVANECKHLGTDFIGMYNRIIGTAPTIPNANDRVNTRGDTKI